MRTCSECGKKMVQGYCIDNGMEYYCDDDCLHKHYTEDEYLKMYDNENGNTYWTEWEDEEDKLMTNHVILVGRLIDLTDDFMTIAVSRPYKNTDGIYEYDNISCKLLSPINKTMEQLKVGKLVGIKAHITINENKIFVVAEKITILN